MFKKGAIMAKADCKKCRGMGSYYGPGCLRFQCECEPSRMHDYDIPPDKAKNHEHAFKVRTMSGAIPKAKHKNPYDIAGKFEIIKPGDVHQLLAEQTKELIV
jgi:hypothetical protein